ncbi:hypothetical protein BDW59DRAFT_163349 [Aspergillus cavernicola]|uniref:Uncharacterized protein n=1 Tax=Aspergillus cavernicola TaxID=176166 RepID=A0ABR4I6K6_9EURO
MQLTFLSHLVCTLGLIPLIQAVKSTASVDTLDPFDPRVTDPPEHAALAKEIEKRQLTQDLIAWSEYSSYWYSITCPANSNYAIHSTYAGCCGIGTSTCNYATACLPNGRVLYYQGEASCDPGSFCDSITVLSSTNRLDDAQTMIWCFSSGESVTHTWYRNTYDLTTSTTTQTRSTTTVTETATQTVEGDDTAGLRPPATMHSILGALMILVLLVVY